MFLINLKTLLCNQLIFKQFYRSVVGSNLPQLKPSQPHQSMNIPRMAVVGEPMGKAASP